LAMRLSPQDWMMQSVRMQQIASKAFGRSGHVVICGFGRSARALRDCCAVNRFNTLR